MVDLHVLLSFARVVTAALAGTISMLAFRAYGRARKRSLLALAGGSGVLAGGYLAEGVLVEFAGWTLERASVFEALTTLVGAGILVASLYLRDATLAVGAPAREGEPAPVLARRSPP